MTGGSRNGRLRSLSATPLQGSADPVRDKFRALAKQPRPVLNRASAGNPNGTHRSRSARRCWAARPLETVAAELRASQRRTLARHRHRTTVRASKGRLRPTRSRQRPHPGRPAPYYSSTPRTARALWRLLLLDIGLPIGWSGVSMTSTVCRTTPRSAPPLRRLLLLDIGLPRVGEGLHDLHRVLDNEPAPPLRRL